MLHLVDLRTWDPSKLVTYCEPPACAAILRRRSRYRATIVSETTACPKTAGSKTSLSTLRYALKAMRLRRQHSSACAFQESRQDEQTEATDLGEVLVKFPPGE